MQKKNGLLIRVLSGMLTAAMLLSSNIASLEACAVEDVYEEDINNNSKICQHDNTVVIWIEPTYFSTGSAQTFCLTCGQTVDMQEIPVLECPHSFSETIVCEPTCSSQGQKALECDWCGALRIEVIPCTEHKYVTTVASEPTCKVFGIKKTVCSICGEVEHEENIARTNHVAETKLVTIPTCKSEGLKKTICKTCGEVISTEKVPKAKHDIETKITKATCNTTGTKITTCKTCGETISSETLPKLQHSLESEVITEPAYKKAGSQRFYCINCDYEEIIEIPELTNCPHESTYIVKAHDASTNTYEVNEMCRTCYKCVKSYIEEGPKKGDGKGDKEECVHSKYKTISMTVKEATANEDGLIETICTNCLEVLKTEVIKAHDIYTIDIGDGNTTEVEGYYDEESALQVFNLLNEYRRENGIPELTWSTRVEDNCDIRAYESSYNFSHERPNGTRWFTLDSSAMNGENLALGYISPSSVMTAWKNSPGHNENMLYAGFKSVAISCFHKVTYSPTTHKPIETVIYVQTFSCYR